MKIKDLTGKKFSRLLVLKLYPIRTATGQARWECLCDCGNQCVVQSTHLQSGHTKSCGCIKKEMDKIRGNTHGMSKNRFYTTYNGIKNRVYNVNEPCYKDYGGRGIKCLWKTFEEFRDDMYESYLTHCKRSGEKNTTIDRKDNDGNYCKENCRWATIKEQCNNRRTNHIITIDGTNKNKNEWLDCKKIKRSTYDYRVFTMKWSPEKALTTPIRKKR